MLPLPTADSSGSNVMLLNDCFDRFAQLGPNGDGVYKHVLHHNEAHKDIMHASIYEHA